MDINQVLEKVGELMTIYGLKVIAAVVILIWGDGLWIWYRGLLAG